MIWQSVFLMTMIDLLIVGTIGYVLAVFVKNIKGLPKPWPVPGMVAIVAGLCLVALFYLSDLLIMHAFPLFMPVAKAMTAMEYLHLNHRWIVALIGLGSISLGFAAASRTMTSTVKSLSASQGELRQALAAREESEQEMRESEERTHMTLLAAKAGTWSWNIISNQATWSEEQYKLMGCEPGSVDATYDNWLTCVHPDDREETRENGGVILPHLSGR